MIRIQALLALTAALGTSVVGFAQTAQPPPDPSAAMPSDVDQARERFERGVELYQDGNFDGALAEFSRAYQTAPNYRILYNIGQVQNERHDYVAALVALEDYLQLGAGEITRDRREEVELELTKLRARIAEVSVRGNVNGAELSLDGLPVAVLPLKSPLLVSAGTRRLTLKKRGYLTAEQVIVVAGGDQSLVAFELEQVAPAPAVEHRAIPPDATAPHASLGAPVWVSLGATGVFAGSAAVLAFFAQDRNRRLDEELARLPADPRRVERVRSELKLYAGLTDGFAAAAALASVATIYFWVTGSERADEPRRPSRTIRMAPAPRGVVVSGDF